MSRSFINKIQKYWNILKRKFSKDEDEDEEKNIKKILLIYSIETVVIFFILIGIPFIIGGVWPPYVTVVSDSMEPSISKGDMVYIVETDRFTSGSDIKGIDTYDSPSDRGDIIVYKPNNSKDRPSIIHRAVFYTEKGENWVKDVDKEHLPANSCESVSNCPAPNEGYITKGDANKYYDQTINISRPVSEDWIIGKKKLNIPYIGWIRVAIS